MLNLRGCISRARLEVCKWKIHFLDLNRPTSCPSRVQSIIFHTSSSVSLSSACLRFVYKYRLTTESSRKRADSRTPTPCLWHAPWMWGGLTCTQNDCRLAPRTKNTKQQGFLLLSYPLMHVAILTSVFVSRDLQWFFPPLEDRSNHTGAFGPYHLRVQRFFCLCVCLFFLNLNLDSFLYNHHNDVINAHLKK